MPGEYNAATSPSGPRSQRSSEAAPDENQDEPDVAMIYDSILQAIGNTPMVRMRRIGRSTGCEILAKCEFLNPGGSVKDRIGRRMLEEAQAAGCIKPGDTLIEPTSGNTGIGLAMAAAVHGYRMIITMPEKMSQEKQVTLEALGAEIIRTPTEAAFDDPESHISVAIQLRDILDDAVILDQYGNPNNPEAHYQGTGREIIEQTDGKIDYCVMTAGTGGTITGVARILKEEIPGIKIIGVDPLGSILAGPGDISSYHVEGIGYDFIPDVLDRELVDDWVKSEDRSSFLMARRLIRQEGLLCGGSSGSAMWAALETAKRVGPDKRIVTLLPDSIRNYMTKFMDDQWMKAHGFTEAGWESGTVGDLLRRIPKRDLITASSSDTLSDSVMRMKEFGVSQMPVIDDGHLVGIITESDLLSRIVEGHASLASAVAEVMFRSTHTLNMDEDAGKLLGCFSNGEVGIVVDDSNCVQGIITKMDLVDSLTHAAPR